jgi:hypothetical protein
MTDIADDEMTLLTDADFPRVDLVGKGANGIPRWLITKQDAGSRGLVPAGLVRELIGNAAEPESGRERVTMPNGLTLTGSPADIAAFIHKASVRDADPEAKEAAVAVTAVAKDDGMGPELDEGVDGMDPTVPLAAPDEMGPGDPTDPGSPAWESIDAATARKWTSIAVRFKNALGILAEREMLEAASADPSDMDNAWDLEDAQCALDYVIGTLAGFAVDEQAEADLCGEAMDAIGKAMDGFDPAPLDVIEGLCGIAKSGRVLSSANEAHIREAAQRLNTVLSSLPQAPVTDDGQPVAKQKETTVTATATETAEPAAKDTAPAAEVQEAEPVTKAAGLLAPIYDQRGTLTGVTDPASILQRVAKADGDDGAKVPMQAVFDENGNLVGIVDPADITPVSGAGGNADATTEAPAADPADMTPQPPADAGTPAGAVDDGTVTKQDADGTREVLRSIVKEALGELLGSQVPAEEIAKQADFAGLRQQVEKLAARLVTVEEQPAKPKVLTNGAVPPAHQMRGQDHGSQPADIAKAAELKRKLSSGDATAAEQNDAYNTLSAMGAAELARIRAAGPRAHLSPATAP